MVPPLLIVPTHPTLESSCFLLYYITEWFNFIFIVNLCCIEAETFISRSYILGRFEVVQYLVSSNLLLKRISVYCMWNAQVMFASCRTRILVQEEWGSFRVKSGSQMHWDCFHLGQLTCLVSRFHALPLTLLSSSFLLSFLSLPSSRLSQQKEAICLPLSVFASCQWVSLG